MTERFPPASTTLQHLTPNGDDGEFRQTIYSLLSMSALMLRTRELYGNRIGVSAPQYTMLMAIAEERSATVGRLAAVLHTSGPFITSEVNKLVRNGLVRKVPNPDDRRSNLLELTPKGKGLVEEVSPMRTAANDLIFGALNPAEIAMFQHLVATVGKQLERAVHMLEGPDWRSQKSDVSRPSGNAD